MFSTQDIDTAPLEHASILELMREQRRNGVRCRLGNQVGVTSVEPGPRSHPSVLRFARFGVPSSWRPSWDFCGSNSLPGVRGSRIVPNGKGPVTVPLLARGTPGCKGRNDTRADPLLPERVLRRTSLDGRSEISTGVIPKGRSKGAWTNQLEG